MDSNSNTVEKYIQSLFIKSSSPFPLPGSLCSLDRYELKTLMNCSWFRCFYASSLALSSPNSEVAIASRRAWIRRFLARLQRTSERITWQLRRHCGNGCFFVEEEEGSHKFVKRIFYRGIKRPLCLQLLLWSRSKEQRK